MVVRYIIYRREVLNYYSDPILSKFTCWQSRFHFKLHNFFFIKLLIEIPNKCYLRAWIVSFAFPQTFGEFQFNSLSSHLTFLL